MQIAILIVLVVIAVILAPWLLALIAAGVAAFGVFLMAGLGFALLCLLVATIWFVIKGISRSQVREPREIIGPRKACKECQAEMPASLRTCPNCGAEN